MAWFGNKNTQLHTAGGTKWVNRNDNASHLYKLCITLTPKKLKKFVLNTNNWYFSKKRYGTKYFYIAR